MPRPNKYDRKHIQNLHRIERQVDAVYMTAADEAAKIAELIGADFNPENLFSFRDYPLTRKRVERLLETLRSGMETAIVNGIRSEWTLANNKNNELCRVVFGDALSHLTQAQQRRYCRSWRDISSADSPPLIPRSSPNSISFLNRLV